MIDGRQKTTNSTRLYSNSRPLTSPQPISFPEKASSCERANPRLKRQRRTSRSCACVVIGSCARVCSDRPEAKRQNRLTDRLPQNSSEPNRTQLSCGLQSVIWRTRASLRCRSVSLMMIMLVMNTMLHTDGRVASDPNNTL